MGQFEKIKSGDITENLFLVKTPVQCTKIFTTKPTRGYHFFFQIVPCKPALSYKNVLFAFYIVGRLVLGPNFYLVGSHQPRAESKRSTRLSVSVDAD